MKSGYCIGHGGSHQLEHKFWVYDLPIIAALEIAPQLPITRDAFGMQMFYTWGAESTNPWQSYISLYFSANCEKVQIIMVPHSHRMIR